MREIKFRGKSVCGWHYGSLVYSPSEGQHYIVEHNDGELQFPVDAETVGQFTERMDCEGKEIYEGDIAVFARYFRLPKFAKLGDVFDLGIVCFSDGRFYVKTMTEPYLEYSIENVVEILGNKFENPGLLKGVSREQERE